MLKFIGKRLAYAILTLFLIATATFFLVAGGTWRSDCSKGRTDAGAGTGDY